MVDRDLVATLEAMLAEGASITARAAVRRMSTAEHASTITRDEWRSARVEDARQRQLAALIESPPDRGSPPGELSSDWRRLNPRLLETFATVARVRSFTAAAQELGLSQSSVSLHIQELEGLSGQQLVVRQGREVLLTHPGANLLSRARMALDVLGEAFGDSRREAQPSSIRIVLDTELGGRLASATLAAIRAGFPRDLITVDARDSSSAAEMILRGDAEIAVVHTTPRSGDLSPASFGESPIGLVGPCEHVLLKPATPIRLGEVVGASLILPDRRHFVRRKLDTAARQRGILIKPEIEVHSLDLVSKLVGTGLLSILPRAAVCEAVRHGTLAFRPLERPALAATFFALGGDSEIGRALVARLLQARSASENTP